MNGRLLAIVALSLILLFSGALATQMGWVALIAISLGILTGRSHTARPAARRRPRRSR